jgi:hypothetical protein
MGHERALAEPLSPASSSEATTPTGEAPTPGLRAEKDVAELNRAFPRSRINWSKFRWWVPVRRCRSALRAHLVVVRRAPPACAHAGGWRRRGRPHPTAAHFHEETVYVISPTPRSGRCPTRGCRLRSGTTPSGCYGSLLGSWPPSSASSCCCSTLWRGPSSCPRTARACGSGLRGAAPVSTRQV